MRADLYLIISLTSEISEIELERATFRYSNDLFSRGDARKVQRRTFFVSIKLDRRACLMEDLDDLVSRANLTHLKQAEINVVGLFGCVQQRIAQSHSPNTVTVAIANRVVGTQVFSAHGQPQTSCDNEHVC